MLTHFSLFTGIGGIDLAAEWAGFESAGQCEWADYQTKVLEKHWPDVPRWRDIRDVTAESFKERTGLDTVTIISGGFPCQPFSSPGKRLGDKDQRFLWPEMCRVIEQIRPSWVLGENVTGFINMGLDEAISDMEKVGYETRAYIIPACATGAPHERARVFIVGHSNSKPVLQANKGIVSIGDERETRKDITWISRGEIPRIYWEIHQPPVCGMDERPTDWMDEFKESHVALGNMVVPQQVFPILRAIAEIELMEEI